MGGILFPAYVRAGQPRGLKVFSEGLVSPVRVCLPLHASETPAHVSKSAEFPKSHNGNDSRVPLVLLR